MPKMTEDELKKLVEAGKIAGFTIDTTEFHHLDYNFQSKMMTALGQFRSTNITFLLSEMTLGEVKSHIRDRMKENLKTLRGALRQAARVSAIAIDPGKAMQHLGFSENAECQAAVLVDNFVSTVAAHLLPVDQGPTIRQLHDLYFGGRPPFSAKKEKKNEFPDAMALLALEHWAEQRGDYLLAVSNDGDWQRYAEGSPRVIVVPQLAAALNLFNGDDAFVASRLAANLESKSASTLRNMIEEKLTEEIQNFYIEADSPFSYETDDEIAEILELKVSKSRFDVVKSDDKHVTVAFMLEATVKFEASFSFFIRDSIDRDYVGIGGNTASTTEDLDVQILATVERDDEGGDPDIIDLEIDPLALTVEFGEVSIDYGDDQDSDF